MKTRILAARDIKQIVSHVGLNELMDQVIEELKVAFKAQVRSGRYVVPKRDGFNYEHPQVGLVEWMPLMRAKEEVLMKMVGYHPANPRDQALPTVLSTLFSFDTRNGHLQLIADGTLATSIRTGAASAVASQLLACPKSQTLGLIGAGAQAVTQLHALSRVFPISEVFVFDLDQENQRSFEGRCDLLGLEQTTFTLVDNPESAAACADILCTITSVAVGAGPVFPSCDLKPSVHINAVGSDFPGKTEIPGSVLNQSFVCPDFRAQAVVEGECQQLEESHIGPELSVLVDDPASFEHLRGQMTVFDSTGFAVEDHAVLAVIQRHAERLKLGQDLQLESIRDPLDPYFGLDNDKDGVTQLGLTGAPKIRKQG